MQRHVGLTEKRMSNKRFRKTEEAILKVFFEGDYYICTKELAKKVGVARSTVYNHHRTAREILPDYERYILRKFRRALRRMTKNKNVKLKSLYMKVLFLIMHEKRIFGVLMRGGRRETLEKIVLEMRVKIVNYAKLPKNSEKMFGVYVSEVVELVVGWGKRGFIEAEIEGLLEDIIYLTDTMRQRLAPLMDE